MAHPPGERLGEVSGITDAWASGDPAILRRRRCLGDGFMLVFRSARRALLQRRVATGEIRASALR
jgi:hypothetical protein